MREEPASAFARQQVLFFGAQIGEKLRQEQNEIPWAYQRTPKSAFHNSLRRVAYLLQGSAANQR